MSKWRPEGWKNPFSISSGADPADGERLVDYEVGADAMLESTCGEIEKVENPYQDQWGKTSPLTVEEMCENSRYYGFEQCRQKILTLLRSKGQPVGPGMWGECPTGPTGVEGPPGEPDK